jgi:hypothetical protein
MLRPVAGDIRAIQRVRFFTRFRIEITAANADA